MFALENENECFRDENKKQQAIIEMLIENSNKNMYLENRREENNERS